MKKLTVLMLIFLLSVTLIPADAFAGSTTPEAPKAPAGSWTEGPAPNRVDPAKPALLFVHGLNSSAEVWTKNNNDMLQKARDAGYQTASINLYDANGTSQDMWDNGKLLADKIKVISNHFGKKLIIIAHSKGGVDTQTALVYNGAAPYVQRVITLSSPHHGSQLADLAYSSWAGWLADIVGSQNPGTSTLQTSYMKYFRTKTDALSNATTIPFFTFAGDNWSGGTASYILGGLYLSSFGKNDGVVTVDNAKLPGGRVVKVGSWDHAKVRTGSYVFSLILPYLQANTPALNQETEAFSAASSLTASAVQSTYNEIDNSYFIRGGDYNGKASETLTVENGVQSIDLDWISDKRVSQLELTKPDGTSELLHVKAGRDEEIFAGAWHHSAVVTNPQPGIYKLNAVIPDHGAYLLIARYHAVQVPELKYNLNAVGPRLNLKSQDSPASVTQVTYQVQYYGDPQQEITTASKGLTLQQKTVNPTGQIELSKADKPGIYSVTYEINGTTAAGYPYRRTAVQSIYIDADGNKYVD
ncbi:esterase/lipase family protein [Paenibacillus polymyxa]|uniref:esterase/lipase family protein n=1 Tax=Paenibacillus polymyxa TaxID=1406 RepID=UPI000F870ED4|nr:alpha/beta hydrolase [Paenibacillus polymyxa]QDA27939.1 alpha/beta hydrolase [Paenibacillus polymyxa]RTZ35545.1 alpha/beta hydrolase [Paenibacillus polymyxa]